MCIIETVVPTAGIPKDISPRKVRRDDKACGLVAIVRVLVIMQPGLLWDQRDGEFAGVIKKDRRLSDSHTRRIVALDRVVRNFGLLGHQDQNADPRGNTLQKGLGCYAG